jgi:hypothetical protein
MLSRSYYASTRQRNSVLLDSQRKAAKSNSKCGKLIPIIEVRRPHFSQFSLLLVLKHLQIATYHKYVPVWANSGSDCGDVIEGRHEAPLQLQVFDLALSQGFVVLVNAFVIEDWKNILNSSS